MRGSTPGILPDRRPEGSPREGDAAASPGGLNETWARGKATVPYVSAFTKRRSAMSNPTISAYDPIPSVGRRASVTVRSELPGADEVGALAVPVVSGGEAPPELGVDSAALAAAGFTGARAQTLVLPHADGVVRVAVGLGSAGTVDRTLVRDVAAEFARAVPQHKTVSVEIPPGESGISVADFAQAVTEGVLLARWRFRVGA